MKHHKRGTTFMKKSSNYKFWMVVDVDGNLDVIHLVYLHYLYFSFFSRNWECKTFTIHIRLDANAVSLALNVEKRLTQVDEWWILNTKYTNIELHVNL